MNITLNIDEKLFDEGDIGKAIKDAFTNMPIEEKSNIMKDILKQYLLDSDFIKRYFIEKRASNYYGTYKSEDYPTKEFRELISNIDFSEDMDDVKKVFIEIVKTDLQEQLTKLMVDSYINTIANSLFGNSSAFREQLSMNILTEINTRINEEKYRQSNT